MQDFILLLLKATGVLPQPWTGAALRPWEAISTKFWANNWFPRNTHIKGAYLPSHRRNFYLCLGSLFLLFTRRIFTGFSKSLWLLWCKLGCSVCFTANRYPNWGGESLNYHPCLVALTEVANMVGDQGACQRQDKRRWQCSASGWEHKDRWLQPHTWLLGRQQLWLWAA